MPVDPNIPLSVQQTRFGEIIGQGIQNLRVRERQESADQRANALLELKQQEVEQKKAAEERKEQTRGFANFAVSTLGPLYQKGDPKAIENALQEEIERVVPGSVESEPLQEALSLHQQNPTKAFQSITQIVKQARADKIISADSGKRVNAELDGKIIPAIETPQGFLINPSTGKRMPNAIKAPTRQAQGSLKDLTASQGGKLTKESIESEQAVSKNIIGLENVINVVSSDDFIGGNTGNVVSLINSASAQVRQFTGSDSVLKDGQLDESQLDISPENMARFRRAAINNDRFDSAILELAYIKAKTLDPAGRISDKDLAASEKILSSGADKASIINLLRDNQKRIIQNYNSDTRVLNKRTGSNIPEISRESILGKKVPETTKTTEQIADQMLKDAGLGR